MSEWLSELRYAGRALARSPGFTAVAVLSLALGIGVNTAVLAVGRAVLFQPLNVHEPGRLAIAYHWRGDQVRGVSNINSGGTTDPTTGRPLASNYTYPAYTALRAAATAQADLFAFTFLRQANISTGGPALSSSNGQSAVGGGMLVSGNYFAAMGVPMHLGRALDERDDRPESEPAAVIGYRLWRRAFGGDPSIVGQAVRVNGHPFTLVGVTAPGYFGVSNGGFFPPADITVPLAAQPLVSPRWTPKEGSLFTATDVQWLRVMARLKDGVDRGTAQAALSSAYARYLSAAESKAFTPEEMPALTLVDGARGLESMRRTFERPLWMLAGVALLVLLIACVNIAGLVLARGIARRQELWVRLALGAGRARLVRQSFVESLLLATAGGTLGVLLALWGSRAMVATLAGTWPTAIDVRLDVPLLLMALTVSVLAALAFGVLPALRLTVRDSPDLMRRSGAAAPRLRAGRALVLIQVAISVPLVVGAALFLRTIHNLARVELGFEPRGLLVFTLDPMLNGYDDTRSKQFFAQVLDRVSAVPGVRQATLIENALVSGRTSSNSFRLPGVEKPRSMLMNRVGPGFFETAGIPIVAGRGLGVQDHASAPHVAVVNEAAARAFFGDANPIGLQVHMGGPTRPPISIVGIASDSKYYSLKQQKPEGIVYLSYFQSAGLGAMHVAVKTASNAGIAEGIRRAVADVDRDVPLTGLKSQQQQIDETIGSERALMLLLVFFGGFALLLACIGLHGVTAYAVTRRTSEIGLRVALGAQRRDVLWMILRQVVGLAAAGLVIGIPAAAAASRTARAMLFGVEPADPWSLALGAGVLFVVAVMAGYFPARRAARLDPLVALRNCEW
jgi:predicted permease